MTSCLQTSLLKGSDRPPLFGSAPIPFSERESSSGLLPRVLVVDDERLLAESTVAILNRSGFEAEAAYDASTALDLMSTFHPDYVLTDIMMPRMNGVELAITITQTYPTTKILLFSGQAGVSEILERSRSQGFEFPLLAKPVHPAKLVERLKALDLT